MVIAKTRLSIKSAETYLYLGMIVHNKHVTDAFEKRAFIRLTARTGSRFESGRQRNGDLHRSRRFARSPQIAEDKGLVAIDATCPDVTKHTI
ncbi:hypothetical protein PO124_08145 [Bacillus licheniformis]|nr:hypothetical protein [Bacillus licheniformis]